VGGGRKKGRRASLVHISGEREEDPQLDEGRSGDTGRKFILTRRLTKKTYSRPTIIWTLFEWATAKEGAREKMEISKRAKKQVERTSGGV